MDSVDRRLDRVDGLDILLLPALVFLFGDDVACFQHLATQNEAFVRVSAAPVFAQACAGARLLGIVRVRPESSEIFLLSVIPALVAIEFVRDFRHFLQLSWINFCILHVWIWMYAAAQGEAFAALHLALPEQE